MQNLSRLTGELVARNGVYSFFKNGGALPNPDKILGIRNYEVLRDLKNDPHVWSCVQSRKSGSLKLEGSVVGGDAKICSELSKMLEDIDLYTLKRDILEAPLFGYQPLEIMWEYVGSRFIVPGKVVAKPQEAFYYDREGELYYRSANSGKGVKVPAGKILTARHEPSFMNPYGAALLSKCYWSVTFKNGGIRFWVNFMEKFGSPTILGKYQRGASQKEIQDLAQALADTAQDSVLVSPIDVDVELIEAARTSSAELYKELIKQCNAEISKALLSQTLTTELDSGSYAASQTHFSVRREIVMADAKLIDSVLDELIGLILYYNYPGATRPHYVTICGESEDVSPADRDIKLYQLGVRLTPDYICKKYGLKPEDFILKHDDVAK